MSGLHLKLHSWQEVKLKDIHVLGTGARPYFAVGRGLGSASLDNGTDTRLHAMSLVLCASRRSDTQAAGSQHKLASAAAWLLTQHILRASLQQMDIDQADVQV